MLTRPQRVKTPALTAQKRLVLDAVRLGGVGARRFFVLLVLVVVALEPHTCESPSNARMCVAMRSRNQRSWLITTAQPAKSRSASSSARSVSTSRSFVGSSSSSRLPPDAQQLREVHAVALAAGEVADLLLLVGAAEVEARHVRARVHLAVADMIRSGPPRDLLPDGVRRVEVGAGLVDVGELDRVAEPQLAARRAAPARRSCGRASSCRRRSAPITPTMPPGGSENVRSSISSRSP